MKKLIVIRRFALLFATVAFPLANAQAQSVYYVRILACVVLLFSGLRLDAADKYYRQGATGNGSGSSWTDAYTSWSTAYSALNGGDTLWVADTASSIGSVTLNKAASGSSTITIKKATVASHGTSTGWSDTYGDGQAQFGDITIQTPYHVINGQTRTETTRMEAPAGYGFRVISFSANSLSSQNAAFSQISYVDVGGSWNESSSPDCSAPGNALYFVYNQNNLTFSRCVFHNAGVNNGAIAMMHGSSDITFDHCDFYMGWGKATIAAPNVGTTRLTVKYCRFWDSTRRDTCPAAEGAGITCEIGSYSVGGSYQHTGHLIYGNIFYGTAFGGRNASVQFGDLSATGGTALNCKVFNNTFVGFPEPSVLGDVLLYAGSGNEARNNLFYNTGSASVSANSVSHNVDAASNPFVDYNARDFRLAGPVSGTSLSSPYNVDPKGDARGSDGTWDVGAYEFAAVNPNLTVNAGPDLQATLPNNSVNLVGSYVNLLGGVVSLSWSKVSGPGTVSFSAPSAATTTATFSSAGTYSLRLTATVLSVSASDDVTVTIQNAPDTTAPTANLTAPTSGGVVSNTVALSATASDDAGGSGVASVSFLVDGVLAGNDASSPYSFNWDSRSVQNGSHVIQARAVDGAGNQATSTSATVSVQNIIDTTAPSVALTAPGAGSTVSNTVTLSASASDNTGGSGIAGVTFLVDGVGVGAEDTTAPYSISWSTLTVASGTHSVAARARDAAGNQTTSSAVSIVVASSQPAALKVGDRVAVNSDPSLRVRSTAALSGTIVGDQLNGALGTIIAGPVSADGYTWWQINYDSAPDGWSIEGVPSSVSWLVPAPSAAPAPPSGLRIVSGN